MDEYQKGRVYDRIDDEEDMTDAEKREAYFGAIAEQEDQEEYENRW